MSDNNTQNLTDGMHIIVDALKKNDIKTIYGVVGIPITDLARHAQAEGIRYIGFRHEQSAGNAAAISGYLTKKPGICLTVSAPGFLNGLVALANATTNGFPMILISGSSDREIIDLQQGDYEELDQMTAAKPYAKASFRVNKPEDIGIALARAIRASVSGRPGGVYLDLTTELLSSVMDKEAADKSTFKVENPAPAQLPAPESVEKALQLLSTAKRPLVILGKGAAYAQADEDIQTFIEKTGIPFLPMSMAKGLLPDTHKQSAAAARSHAISHADVIVLLGARLNWLLGHGKGKNWSADTQLIQVDIDANEMDSNRHITAPVVGDMNSVMAQFVSGLDKFTIHASQAWTDELDAIKVTNGAKMAAKLNKDVVPMNYFCALRAIRDVLVDYKEAYVVNEGANTLDNGRNIIDMYRPRQRLDCGTWGVMGIGMGYAIGAAATSGKPVVAIEGDSAFGFSGMEIETICRYQLPVTILVFNNGGVYRGDDINRHGDSDPAPTYLMKEARYDKMMEAFGGQGFNATTSDEIKAALLAGLQSGKPTLINCVIDPTVGTESGHLTNLNPQSVDKK
ncbi:oxalyl-CoA decarboxylase [Orbus mooreae]|uniref:oxalyl-CoA decarboxylase n=1 Tax=Orbus mooreae TaxID=3074107 RepID=UPI00370D8396